MLSIRELIAMKKKELGITNNELAEMSGLNVSTINYLTSGKTTNPSLDTILAIAPFLGIDLGDLNPDGIEYERPPMLIDSTGSMSRFFSLGEDAMDIAWEYSRQDEHGKRVIRALMDEENRRRSESGATLTLLDDTDKTDGASEIPAQKETELQVFDEPAAAGAGNYSEGDVSHTIYLRGDLVPQKTNFGVTIQGLSMLPQIPDGCIVFVQATPALNNGEIGIFVMDGQSYCKQLKMDDRGVRLHSLNPEFPDVSVSPYADLRTLGRVLGYYDESRGVTVQL